MNFAYNFQLKIPVLLTLAKPDGHTNSKTRKIHNNNDRRRKKRICFRKKKKNEEHCLCKLNERTKKKNTHSIHVNEYMRA